jgi:hypothetical protein
MPAPPHRGGDGKPYRCQAADRHDVGSPDQAFLLMAALLMAAEDEAVIGDWPAQQGGRQGREHEGGDVELALPALAVAITACRAPWLPGIPTTGTPAMPGYRLSLIPGKTRLKRKAARCCPLAAAGIGYTLAGTDDIPCLIIGGPAQCAARRDADRESLRRQSVAAKAEAERAGGSPGERRECARPGHPGSAAGPGTRAVPGSADRGHLLATGPAARGRDRHHYARGLLPRAGSGRK